MKISKRLFAILLAMLMLLGSVPMSEAFAVQTAEDKPKVFEYRPDEAEEPWKIPDGYVFTGKTNYGKSGERIFQLLRNGGIGGFGDIMWISADGREVDNPDIHTLTFTNLPKGSVKGSVSQNPTYDARDYGYVMPVEDQVGGSCWAHAICAAAESNYIKKGYADTVDFSEYHMVWYALNGYSTENNYSDNDGYYFINPEDVIDNGAFPLTAANSFLNFAGPVFESRFPLKSTTVSSMTKEMQSTFTYDNRYLYDAVIKDMYCVKNDVASMKKAIELYGVAYIEYASRETVGNWSDEGYCCYTPYSYPIDHAVVIVGWDDNYSKNNFGTYKPQNNGAWLVKNSWGTNWGNDGYFWLSYEDKTIGKNCYVFDVDKADDYQNVYMYDGFCYSMTQNYPASANVFTAKGNERITKVVYGGQADKEYTLKIYRNLPYNYTNPTDGTLVYTQKGTTGNTRFIELNNDVEVTAGELFAVVIEMDTVYFEGTNYTYSNCYLFFNSKKGESYFLYENDLWLDVKDCGLNNICIKVVTENIDNSPPYEITFRDSGYHEEKYTTYTNSISLPKKQGHTYVLTYNNSQFTGEKIYKDMTVEMHCYPTEGKRVSPCSVEYRCIYCNKEVKPALTKHSVTSTVVPASQTVIGHTYNKCIVCNAENYGSYKLYTGAVGGKSGNLIWQYVNNNLAVMCLGRIPDFTVSAQQPWSKYNSLIKKATVYKGVTRLGNYFFAGMNKLTSVSLPSSITEIGEYCFSGASALKTFTCPSELRVIEFRAFKDATSLTTINYNKKLTRLGNYVFEGCCSMKVGVVPGTLVGPDAIGLAIFLDCESLEKIVIEEGVTHFDETANWSGSSLKEIHIPSTVVSFAGCNYCNLEKYIVSPYNRYYTDVDGVLFNKNLTTLVSYPTDKRGAYYNIPDTVTEISEDAFYCTWYLRYLDMSCAVTTLEKDAFNCTFSIEAVNLPSGLKKICTEALNDVSFESLYVPSTVTTIEKDAITANEMNDYHIEAFYTNSSSAAIKNYAANNGYKCYTTHTKHNYSYSFNDTATTEESGVSLKSCGCGCFKVNSEIPRIASIKLSANEAVYNGKTRTPSVIVKDINGNTLVNGTDYTVTYASGRKFPGEYSVAVEFIGDYYGTEYLTFIILPSAPTKVSVIQNTSAIKLSWNACEGATGYRIYYKSGNTWKICLNATTATTHTFTGLKAGSKFTFAVRPYIITDSGVAWSGYTTYTASTLPATVSSKVSSTSKGKLTLNWNAVAGADGYQVWYKTGNGAYKLYNTYSKAGTLNFAGLKSGTKYTFAVRAGIRTSGGNIFGAYKTATVTVK